MTFLKLFNAMLFAQMHLKWFWLIQTLKFVWVGRQIGTSHMPYLLWHHITLDEKSHNSLNFWCILFLHNKLDSVSTKKLRYYGVQFWWFKEKFLMKKFPSWYELANVATARDRGIWFVSVPGILIFWEILKK